MCTLQLTSLWIPHLILDQLSGMGLNLYQGIPGEGLLSCFFFLWGDYKLIMNIEGLE